MDFIFSTFKEFFLTAKVIGETFYYVWFLVFPAAFYYLFKHLWVKFVQRKFSASIEWTLLEIIPPRDIEKSPKLMESLFSGLSGTLKSPNVFEEYLDGYLTHFFSFELVSDEGTVHFYIRTPKIFRNLVEAHLYAQYPTLEITEVPDYVDNIPKVIPDRDWDLWGTDFVLVKDDAYPIRTYLKFEESVTGKMIDPLAGLAEVMGKIGAGQKIWFQYIIIPVKEDWYYTGYEIVKKLTGRAKQEKGILEKLLVDIGDVFSNFFRAFWGEFKFSEEKKEEMQPLEFRLTPGEKDILKAVEENIGKNVFNVKMRFVYLGRRENFNKSTISAFMGGIKQFADQNLNSFKPHDPSKTYASFLFAKPRLQYRQRKIFRLYKDRDPEGAMFILSTTELATLYHMPDMSVLAPSIVRVDARKGGAPANLPVE